MKLLPLSAALLLAPGCLFGQSAQQQLLISQEISASTPPAYVQGSAGVIFLPASTTVASSATATTTGNLLVVAIRWGNVNCAGETSTALMDTAGDTFTIVGSCAQPPDGVAEFMFVAKNITGNAANVVIATGALSSFNTINVMEFSGLNHSTPLDQSAQGAVNFTTVTSGSFTTTSANEVLAACAEFDTTGNTFAPQSGYTLSSGSKDSQGVSQCQYQIVSAIQTGVTSSMTVGASNPAAIVVGTFKQ